MLAVPEFAVGRSYDGLGWSRIRVCSGVPGNLPCRDRDHMRSGQALDAAAQFGPRDHHIGANDRDSHPGAKAAVHAIRFAIPGFKDAKERLFVDGLRSNLKIWVKEAPSSHQPEIKQHKEVLAKLDRHLLEDGGDTVTQAECNHVFESVIALVLATVAPFTVQVEIERLSEIVRDENAMYHGLYHNILTQQVENSEQFAVHSGFPQRTADLAKIEVLDYVVGFVLVREAEAVAPWQIAPSVPDWPVVVKASDDALAKLHSAHACLRSQRIRY